jgi:6,7-dimethyl-8-ribityllumazine synthase
LDRKEVSMDRCDGRDSGDGRAGDDGSSRRIAFVQACWHKEIVDQGRDAFVSQMARLGYPAQTIELFEVPGSLEIPLRAKILAESGRYAAIVAAGFVGDGGIYRHDFVAGTVIDGLMRIQLDTEVPILSMVLTPQRFHEHDEHRRFFLQHFVVKGTEAAVACARTVENIESARLLRARNRVGAAWDPKAAAVSGAA